MRTFLNQDLDFLKCLFSKQSFSRYLPTAAASSEVCEREKTKTFAIFFVFSYLSYKQRNQFCSSTYERKKKFPEKPHVGGSSNSV